MNISVKDDFSEYPGGRYRKHGPGSGQEFREDILNSALANHEKISISFDGVAALPPSFIDESVGHFLREWGKARFDERIEVIISDDPDALEVYEKIRDESPR